jgi:hypothetical protein
LIEAGADEKGQRECATLLRECWYAKAVAASRVYSPGVREINRLGPTNLLRQSGMELNSIFTDASDLTDCLNAFSAFCDKPREREREREREF